MAGSVVNALTGQPVASASVAIAPISHGMERDISKSVSTGSDGRFVFNGLSRGKYSLMAEARGFPVQFFEHHDPYATAIAVGPDIDSEHLVFRLQPDTSLEGDVTDENNEPIRFASVRLFRRDTEDGRQRTYPINQAQTDDQGHYHMGHLSPGTYYLAVSARPWYAQNARPPRGPQNADADARAAQDAAALDVTYPLTYYSGTTDAAEATPLQLAAGERETADVVLHATPSLHLRIHTGGTDSPVLGKMIFPRVSHRVFEGYVDPVGNAPDSWVAPGVIEISGLAPGHYIIEMPASDPGNPKNSTRAWYREIELTGDMDITSSDGPGFAAVSGSIVFEGLSRAPKDETIVLLNRDTGENFRSDVGEKGDFDFPSDQIRPGRYLMLLEGMNGFYLRTFSASGAKVTGQSLEMSGGSVRVNAAASQGAARVEGTAMKNGQPVAGAMVVLVPQDPANNSPLFRRDQSDSDGTFTLPQVVPGPYTVIAIANGWDLEWANPSVLQRYLKQGESVQVPTDGKLNVKVQVQ